MPTTRYRPGLFLMPAAGLTLAVLGLAAGTDAHSREELPMRCEIAVSEVPGSRTYRARLHALQDVAGGYRLRLGSAGASVEQSGDFRLAAGETETLGEVTLGGQPAPVEAELTLDWNGKTLVCPFETDL